MLNNKIGLEELFVWLQVYRFMWLLLLEVVACNYFCMSKPYALRYALRTTFTWYTQCFNSPFKNHQELSNMTLHMIWLYIHLGANTLLLLAQHRTFTSSIPHFFPWVSPFPLTFLLLWFFLFKLHKSIKLILSIDSKWETNLMT